MIVKNISAAKAELSALIDRVERGEEVLIARAGRPVVRLVRYQGITRSRRPGALKGRIEIAPDFDVLPEDVARALGLLDQ